jgi:hypothetical protein
MPLVLYHEATFPTTLASVHISDGGIVETRVHPEGWPSHVTRFWDGVLDTWETSVAAEPAAR